MSLRAQRNFCLLAIAGAMWTLGVLWFPISQWEARAHHAKIAPLTDWKFGWMVAERTAPPANWKELSALLLIPGSLALTAGLVGTAAGLVANCGFRTRAQPRNGT